MRVQREVDAERGTVTLSFELPLGIRSDLGADIVYAATLEQLEACGSAAAPEELDVAELSVA